MIGGSIMADKGDILLNNKNIANLREEQRAIHIGRVYQDPSMGVSPFTYYFRKYGISDKKR